MDTGKSESVIGSLPLAYLRSLVRSHSGLGISMSDSAYSDDDLDYLDKKLQEWAFDDTTKDFVEWMQAGNDTLKVLKYKDE